MIKPPWEYPHGMPVIVCPPPDEVYQSGINLVTEHLPLNFESPTDELSTVELKKLSLVNWILGKEVEAEECDMALHGRPDYDANLESKLGRKLLIPLLDGNHFVLAWRSLSFSMHVVTQLPRTDQALIAHIGGNIARKQDYLKRPRFGGQFDTVRYFEYADVVWNGLKDAGQPYNKYCLESNTISLGTYRKTPGKINSRSIDTVGMPTKYV